jgi:N-acetylmuramoyl-L-alanine amidase
MSERTSRNHRCLWAFGIVILLIAAVLAAACTGRTALSAASPPTATNVGTTNPTPSSPSPSVDDVLVPRPAIVWKPIPFPESRKQETLAYSREHYGLDTFSLVQPQMIVEHFTANDEFDPVFNTFAADQPHLGELPGTCAHFVIDSDGTIYQLVPLDLMCRHTVGLNYTAIGIEMVGESDQDILGNPQQLAAALNLTLWLMQQLDIELRNVIGHNESLTSPFHQELVPSLRCQTHQDWSHEDMEVFRDDLAQLATTFRVPLGPAATPVDSEC